MKRAFVNMVTFEQAGQGLHLGNVGELYYGYRVSDAYYMFFVTFVLCFALGVYVTEVLRVGKEGQDEGVGLPWYYPISPGYWAGKRNTRKVKEHKVVPMTVNEKQMPIVIQEMHEEKTSKANEEAAFGPAP